MEKETIDNLINELASIGTSHRDLFDDLAILLHDLYEAIAHGGDQEADLIRTIDEFRSNAVKSFNERKKAC